MTLAGISYEPEMFSSSGWIGGTGRKSEVVVFGVLARGANGPSAARKSTLHCKAD